MIAEVPARISDFLGKAVDMVRERFGGKISYASLPLERVDWTPVDFISTDAGYRSIEVADRYRDDIRALVARGKPVAITEFGAPPTAAPPIWAAVATRWSNWATTAGRSG